MKRSPEELFLLEFVKCCFGNGDFPTLEQHLSQTSWENILPVITAHELQALVYSRLKEGILPVKPPIEVLSHLRSYTTQISMHNLIGESEGSRVISRLQEKEIFFLLLKGVPLMEMIYGQSWMRPASDVDILIDPADYSRVESLLLKDGFVHVVPEGFQDRTEDFLIIQKDFGEMHFFKPTSSLLFNLDVHWRVSGLSTQSPLLTLFPIDTYPWLTNPGRGRFGRLSVPRLNNEMLFFHLVFHFALHHHLRGLRTFLDLCSFCSQYGESLDGDFLRHVVPEENCRKIVTLVLMFVRKYTGKDLTLHFLPPSPPPLHLLPGEKRWYAQQLLVQENTVMRYLTLFLYPVKWRDKWIIVKYCLFHPDSLPRRWKHLPTRGFSPITYPFFILSHLLREKKKKKSGDK